MQQAQQAVLRELQVQQEAAAAARLQVQVAHRNSKQLLQEELLAPLEVQAAYLQTKEMSAVLQHQVFAATADTKTIRMMAWQVPVRCIILAF